MTQSMRIIIPNYQLGYLNMNGETLNEYSYGNTFILTNLLEISVHLNFNPNMIKQSLFLFW